MPKHEEWLRFAEDDLKTARIVLSSSEPVIGSILSHCQQCVEKALKSYLRSKGEEIRRTHDLVLLTKACMVYDKDFESFLLAAADLSPFLMIGRYPDSCFVMPDLSIAQDAVKQATIIFDFVKTRL